VCLTFDLRGHTGGTGIPLSRVTREDNLRDLLAAYDRLLAHPALDTSAIAVVGTSYGGYLARSSPRCARCAGWRCGCRRCIATINGTRPSAIWTRLDLRDYRSTLVRRQ
jgi:dienelactone hydrolase